MAVILYSGLPGKGKTACITNRAIKKFRSDNSFLSKTSSWISLMFQGKFCLPYTVFKDFKKNPVNKVYSNYPILLDLKKKIYSLSVSPKKLEMNYQFKHGSIIIIDEVQRYFNSREFKTFPKKLGIFFQHHRHGSIDEIILSAQSPSRYDLAIRELSEIYRKYRLWWTLPGLPFIFVTYTDYYEEEDYGKNPHIDKDIKTYEADFHFKFIKKSDIYPRYNTKYFHIIFDDLPMCPEVPFTGLDLTLDQLNDIGLGDL